MASANQEPTKKMDMDISDPPPPSPPASQPLSDADDIRQRKLDMYAAMEFHEPVILKTTAAGYERRDGEITIDELLMPDKLRGAFLASKEWDLPWLKTKINEEPLRHYHFFMHAEDKKKKAFYREQFGTGSLNHGGDQSKFGLHFPPLHRNGSAMNAKLMVLAFGGQNFIRLVITTANMVPADWGEKVGEHEEAAKENMVFVADLPRLFEGDEDTNNENQFYQSFYSFAIDHLHMGRLPQNTNKPMTIPNIEDPANPIIITDYHARFLPVEIFDFQKLAKFGFIYTASGYFKASGPSSLDGPMGFHQLADFVGEVEDSDEESDKVVDEDSGEAVDEDSGESVDEDFDEVVDEDFDEVEDGPHMFPDRITALQLGFQDSTTGRILEEYYSKAFGEDAGEEDADEDSAAFGLMEVDFVTQTLEHLDEKYLRTLYLAAQGNNSQELQRLRAKGLTPEAEEALQREVIKATGDGWKKHVRIYYPSDMTVRSSTGGKNSAFDIRCPLTGPSVPKKLLRDCKSFRVGVLVCSNLWYVQFAQRRELSTGLEVDGILYVGSAGLSESSWGRYTTHKEMDFANYECGVVTPITKDEDNPPSRVAKQKLKLFKPVVPVPMQVPGMKFVGEKEPWKVDPGRQIARYLVNKDSDR